MREGSVVVQRAEFGAIACSGWSEIAEKALLRCVEFAFWLASVYLTACYGLPIETLYVIKEKNP